MCALPRYAAEHLLFCSHKKENSTLCYLCAISLVSVVNISFSLLSLHKA